MTKKKFIEILVSEGFYADQAEEVWNSPKRIPARKIDEELVRRAAKDTKVHIALEALATGSLVIISLC